MSIEDNALYLSHLYSVPKSQAMQIIQFNGFERAKEIYSSGVAWVEFLRIRRVKGEI